MKLFITGLDSTTVTFLKEGGAVVEQEDVQAVDDLEGWIKDGLYDVAVVDLDKSRLGVYMARGFRTKKITTPIVGISRGSDASSWSDYRAMFLENGGDDLLRGPTNPRELMASLRVVMRRFHGAMVDIVEHERGGAKLKVNLTRRTVFVNDEAVHLTGKELSMMLMFASAPSRVMSKEMILGHMYTGGIDDEPEMKIIDVFVCKVRKKLTDIHPDANFIDTVWGRGFRLASQKGEDSAAVAAELSDLKATATSGSDFRSVLGVANKGKQLNNPRNGG